MPLDTSTSVDAPVRDGESMMCTLISVRNQIISNFKPANQCGTSFGVLARVYLVVRVNHPSNDWGDKVENCKLSFRGLVKLLKHPDVKADVAKVRGARGREFVYKAESLAVELSGSSDDDN